MTPEPGSGVGEDVRLEAVGGEGRHRVEVDRGAVDGERRRPADAVGAGVLALVARAQASGVDADQAVRAAVRALEERVVSSEAD